MSTTLTVNRLPEDVWLSILDIVDDKPTCALVCRAWYRHVSIVRFRTITLVQPFQTASAKKKRSRLPAHFVAMLYSSPNIGSFIRSLSFRGYDSWLEEVLPHIGCQLTQLESLKFIRCNFMQFTQIGKTALRSAFTGIAELVLERVAFATFTDFTDFLSSLPGLRSLTLRWLYFEPGNVDLLAMTASIPSMPQMPFPGLRHLTLEMFTVEEEELFLAWVLSNRSCLRLRSLQCRATMTVDLETSWKRFIALTGTELEGMVIVVRDDRRYSVQGYLRFLKLAPFRINICPRLSTVSLLLSSSEDDWLHPDFFIPVVQFLGDVGLKLSVFKLAVHSTNLLNFQDTTYWEEVVDPLTRLRQVRTVVIEGWANGPPGFWFGIYDSRDAGSCRVIVEVHGNRSLS